MEEETHRREYVLTETGRIWLGTVGKFCVRPWNFGQVSKGESMCLLKLGEYGWERWANSMSGLRTSVRLVHLGVT